MLERADGRLLVERIRRRDDDGVEVLTLVHLVDVFVRSRVELASELVSPRFDDISPRHNLVTEVDDVACVVRSHPTETHHPDRGRPPTV
ncbi:hypothetical protein GCM10025298_27640 [Natronobiforma cellulositropha]